jgi:hypothetical protein
MITDSKLKQALGNTEAYSWELQNEHRITFSKIDDFRSKIRYSAAPLAETLQKAAAAVQTAIYAGSRGERPVCATAARLA